MLILGIKKLLFICLCCLTAHIALTISLCAITANFLIRSGNMPQYSYSAYRGVQSTCTVSFIFIFLFLAGIVVANKKEYILTKLYFIL